MKLVSTVDEVVDNIRTYQDEVRRNEFLQARIAKTIWWYAARNGDGWFFAPSKFVGYVGMTAEIYRQNYGADMHGGDTEKSVGPLFVEVGPGASSFTELEAALEAFVASLGKKVGRRFGGFRVAPDTLETLAPVRRSDEDARIAARIVSDPDICGGRPRIRGTRVRVVDIMQMLSAGMRSADIVADFPYITEADIAAALAYSARAVDHAIIRAA